MANSFLHYAYRDEHAHSRPILSLILGICAPQFQKRQSWQLIEFDVKAGNQYDHSCNKTFGKLWLWWNATEKSQNVSCKKLSHVVSITAMLCVSSHNPLIIIVIIQTLAWRMPDGILPTVCCRTMSKNPTRNKIVAQIRSASLWLSQPC